MTTTERHDWSSPDYVAEWMAGDVLRDLLALPRTLTTELVRDGGTEIGHIIDLGSGPGAYLEPLLDAFPDATATWVDDSPPMEEAAREQLAKFGARVSFVVADASRPDRLDLPPADVVTTSRMVHHFSEEAARALYRWSAEQLRPGGWFANLDHFGSPGDWEPAYRRVRATLTGRHKDPKDRHRHDHPFRLLAEHLAWVDEAGLGPADVPWKTFHTALIVGRKPAG